MASFQTPSTSFEDYQSFPPYPNYPLQRDILAECPDLLATCDLLNSLFGKFKKLKDKGLTPLQLQRQQDKLRKRLGPTIILGIDHVRSASHTAYRRRQKQYYKFLLGEAIEAWKHYKPNHVIIDLLQPVLARTRYVVEETDKSDAESMRKEKQFYSQKLAVTFASFQLDDNRDMDTVLERMSKVPEDKAPIIRRAKILSWTRQLTEASEHWQLIRRYVHARGENLLEKEEKEVPTSILEQKALTHQLARLSKMLEEAREAL